MKWWLLGDGLTNVVSPSWWIETWCCSAISPHHPLSFFLEAFQRRSFFGSFPTGSSVYGAPWCKSSIHLWRSSSWCIHTTNRPWERQGNGCFAASKFDSNAVDSGVVLGVLISLYIAVYYRNPKSNNRTDAPNHAWNCTQFYFLFNCFPVILRFRYLTLEKASIHSPLPIPSPPYQFI